MSIGIGIANFNRNEVFYQTLEQIKKYAPKGAKIVVVDDGSAIPIKDADFRFDKNLGTPTAKNKCLQLLEDCEHIFLFDSDLRPIKKGWEKPYINSQEPHLNFTFRYDSFEWNGHKVCNHPNGCMMYINNSALKKVGGFDTDFERYGYWHGSFSCRVYNAGLTSFPFMDVIGSEKYFDSLDEKKTVQSATPNKGKYLAKNKKRYQEKNESFEFIPYKKETDFKVWYSNPFSTEKNIGKAYNDFCALIPDEDWIAIQDGDAMYLTSDWGVQIKEIIKQHGNDFDLIGCVTNRLGRPIQLAEGVEYDNFDIKYHYQKAIELKGKYGTQVEDITNRKYIAGLLMIFPKRVWNKIKFQENCIYFDDQFSKAVAKSGGRLGLAKGLYMFHFYRGWADNPRESKEHLK